MNRFLRRLCRSDDHRPLLDLCQERNVASCLYGARTGMVQASPIAPRVSYLPARFSDGSTGEATREIDMWADLLTTPFDPGEAA